MLKFSLLFVGLMALTHGTQGYSKTSHSSGGFLLQNDGVRSTQGPYPLDDTGTRDSFVPLGSLDALGESEYTRIRHPAFPKHGVRIKKTMWCDGTVNSYTGYIDIEARHLFFYFFESRNNPDTDDVIFWTNGGPGCTSSVGLFMELGPCRVLDADGPKFHPESWNSNANIFFIDQPIGAGFSYAEYGETVATTEEAAKDIAAFVAVFFEHFTKFKRRSFHMAGESYAGHSLPIFASTIYDQNAYLVRQGLTPINVASIMIGNGFTDVYTMLPTYGEFPCTHASVPPFLSINDCVTIKQLTPRCTQWLKAACLDHFDAIDCNAANQFCRKAIGGPFVQSGKNAYDVSKNCTLEELEDSLCYSDLKNIWTYLDEPDVRAMLGVDPSVPSGFSACNNDVLDAFRGVLDEMHSSVDYVAALLERGVRVLIYVGSYDWICNWVGNEKWTLEMEWSGKYEFNNLALRDWNIDGKAVGKMRSAKGLTFATITAAGHMAPYDKPKETLEMVNRWLSGHNDL